MTFKGRHSELCQNNQAFSEESCLEFATHSKEKRTTHVSAPNAERGVLPETETGPLSDHTSWYFLMRSNVTAAPGRCRGGTVSDGCGAASGRGLLREPFPPLAGLAPPSRFTSISWPFPRPTCLTTRLTDTSLRVGPDFPVRPVSVHSMSGLPSVTTRGSNSYVSPIMGTPLPNRTRDTSPSLLRLCCPPL